MISFEKVSSAGLFSGMKIDGIEVSTFLYAFISGWESIVSSTSALSLEVRINEPEELVEEAVEEEVVLEEVETESPIKEEPNSSVVLEKYALMGAVGLISILLLVVIFKFIKTFI